MFKWLNLILQLFLPQGSQTESCDGHNRWDILSFYTADYFVRQTQTIVQSFSQA